MAAANGVVTADAKAAFDRALKIDPQDVMARFYTGMAADQDGRRAEADKIWNDLIAGAPPNAPWIEVVRHALARNAPAAAATAPAAAAQGAPPDHEVNAMVERLAERLKKDGSDVQGWLQLVRSYRVLNQNDKMEAALADARKALASDADKLKQFNDGAVAAASAAPPAAPGPARPKSRQRPSRRPRSRTIDRRHGAAAGRPAEEGRFRRQWLAAARTLVPGARAAGQDAGRPCRRAQGAGRRSGQAETVQCRRRRGDLGRGGGAADGASIGCTPAAPPAGLPGPTAADIAAAAQMKPDQQNDMIRSMVARLADKLKTDGSDLAGWERLLRAYMVLGDHAKAVAAAADARKALAGDADKLRQIDAVIKDLKVEG